MKAILKDGRVLTALPSCGVLCTDGVKRHIYTLGIEIERIIPDEIEPIPITEELLLKCGFDEPCDGVYEHNYGEFEVTKEQEKWWVTWNGGADFWFEIKHLHQLQNAYYLATEEELEIKL